MNKKLKKTFEACNKFIEESSQEELKEYEKNLNLDYNKYLGSDGFSSFIKLDYVANEFSVSSCKN